MVPFLKQIAAHYATEDGLQELCFVFPNRRSLVFFKKYLAGEVCGGEKPLRSPRMLTINDLFSSLARTDTTDKVGLLLLLYRCYAKLNPLAESLDDFVFWGDVLLGDFGDVDKYLVDPEKLFRNVADFKSLQDDFSYMDEGQKEAVRRFLSHFNDGERLTVDSASARPGMKERFLQVWEIMYPLYRDFNACLDAEGCAYEGKVYRKVADSLEGNSVADLLSEVLPGVIKYVFVGLNALNACEKKLLRAMRNARLAEFCWDHSSEWIRDPHNKSSFFMSENLEQFPQAFETDSETLPKTEFRVISVSSSAGQAKLLPGILESIGKPGIDTAIVLPDERALLPVLNSIPEEIEQINVTMGYPMQESELWSLMSDIHALQMHLGEKNGEWYFYHKQVWAIFSDSVFRAVIDEEGRKRIDEIKKAASYYIPAGELSSLPVFDNVFRVIVRDPSLADAAVTEALADYQLDIVSDVARRLKELPDMAMELDFAKDFYQMVSSLKARLASSAHTVKPATYFRMLQRLASSASVPFKGEPLKGLQIMGPLETRALDFDNLIILSCNEGFFPRRSVSASFIPAELRKGFSMPTYEYQDAMWAYYFYRMIQRAGKVWMLCDSRTEVNRTGEESRFIKQLELHFGADIKRYAAKAGLQRRPNDESVEKTADDIALIRSRRLSASVLQKYLACPVSFYFSFVKGLSADDEISESLDASMVGNVFHRTMQELYSGKKEVTKDYLSSLLNDKDRIDAVVKKHILKELNDSFEVTGVNLIYEDMVCRYVKKTIERDIELIDRCKVSGIRIEGLELKQEWEWKGFLFKGTIDRLDSLLPGEIRVVDYKTGRVTDKDTDITPSNAAKVVGKLFGPAEKDRPKIALQLFLYDMSIKDRFEGRVVVNSVYQTNNLFVSPVRNLPVCGEFEILMEEKLEKLLNEIVNPELPFQRTMDTETCKWCDFKLICGR